MTNFWSLFVCLLLPTWITCAVLCRGKGFRNSTDGQCTCISGFHGQNCEYKYCPFGKSWLSEPIADNARNMPLVPCSNMGFCNILSGQCECRSGYEGRACERMACPTNGISTVLTSGPLLHLALDGTQTFGTVTDLTHVSSCSGHGVCRSMREMAYGFNGITLIRPPTDYSNWEADKLQGCLCDPGYEGQDCSLRSCPKGRDPSLLSGEEQEERFLLQCQANGGYFSILVLGQYTPPIPFDADPGYLKQMIEGIYMAGNVKIVMPEATTGGLPTVCAEHKVITTEISFLSYQGDRPPLLLTRNTSSTREWSDGGTALNLDGSNPVLRMNTLLDDVSLGVNITQSGARDNIITALNTLSRLQTAGWTNLNVNVTLSDGGEDIICQQHASTVVKISLWSDYGNIPNLGIIDASLDALKRNYAANITLTTNKGNGNLYECSNQGYCNHELGVCDCLIGMDDGKVSYRTEGTDDKLHSGTTGNCGYVSKAVPSCLSGGKDACSGNGRCVNSTHTCECREGWYGLTCSVRACPVGPAWVDEPLSSSIAHQPVECSGRGLCDKTTGLCTCSEGFIGPACGRKDCVRDAVTGSPCSGHGVCMSIASFSSQFGFSYGNKSRDIITNGGTWDATSWSECVCSAKVAAGFRGDWRHPSVGASALISGVSTGAIPLPGWGNWDCSLRNCPKGDTVTRRNNYGGVLEIQRVLCRKSAHTNTSDYFLLNLYGVNSARIYTNFKAFEIKRAIESMPLIGNVSVWFPNFYFDNVSTACSWGNNRTEGGFLVQFNTEFGDIPLFKDVLHTNITISEHQKGTNANLECGGSSVGFCDRTTGSCVCNKPYVSSNGTGLSAGNIGDCGYFSGIPQPSDAPTAFGVGKEDF